MKRTLLDGVRRLTPLLAALLLASTASALLPAQARAATGRYLDPIFSSLRIDTDVQYGRVVHADGRIERLLLDLYRPAGDKARKRPAVIFVHGGDSSNEKEFARNQLVGRMFAKRGFVGAVIEYRDGTGGPMRDAAWDLRAAVRWFKKYADALRVSKQRIIVMGVSGGAMTAMNVTFNPDDAGDSGHPGYPSNVAAGISLSGNAVEPHNIGFDEPPIAMIVAKDDHPFYEGSIATCELTKAYGNACELYLYEQGGHPPPFWLNNSDKIIEQSSRFICKHVLGPVVCRDRNGDGQVDG